MRETELSKLYFSEEDESTSLRRKGISSLDEERNQPLEKKKWILSAKTSYRCPFRGEYLMVKR